MTKTEFVGVVVEKTGFKKADAEKAVSAFLSAVEDCLKKGDKVTFTGFGTFEVSERAARAGRNPQTGKEIKIAASKMPKFKAGKTLKDAVNTAKK